MRIRLLFFASLAQSLGRRTGEMDLPEGAHFEEIWTRLVVEQPALARAAHPAFARNGDYAPPSATLVDGDEVALLPPVGGG